MLVCDFCLEKDPPVFPKLFDSNGDAGLCESCRTGTVKEYASYTDAASDHDYSYCHGVQVNLDSDTFSVTFRLSDQIPFLMRLSGCMD